jgi:membrane protein DedA with SNARE-associated domain
MVDILFDLLESYGYPIVFVAAMLENVFVVGMFMPGQAVVLAAGLASRFAALDPWWVAAAAAVGEIVGNGISIAVGRYAGRPFIDERAEWLREHDIDVDKAREFVEKHGAKALLLGRPAWGLKNIIPAIVGASDMPVWRAMGYVALASALYYPAIVSLGYLLGVGFEEATQYATWLGVAIAIVFLVLLYLAWRAFKRHVGSDDG